MATTQEDGLAQFFSLPILRYRGAVVGPRLYLGDNVRSAASGRLMLIRGRRC
jgi:hypothetical protein